MLSTPLSRRRFLQTSAAGIALASVPHAAPAAAGAEPMDELPIIDTHQKKFN